MWAFVGKWFVLLTNIWYGNGKAVISYLGNMELSHGAMYSHMIKVDIANMHEG